MGTAWGNALESLGQSLPAMGQSIDKTKLQQQQYLLDLAASQRQNNLANAQLPQMAADTQAKELQNTAAQTEQNRLAEAVQKVNELQGLPQQIDQLQSKQPAPAPIGVTDALLPYMKPAANDNGAPGGLDISPLRPEAADRIQKLSAMSSLERGRSVLGSVADVGPAKEMLGDLQQEQLRQDQIGANTALKEATLSQQRNLQQERLDAATERQKEHQEFLSALQQKREPDELDTDYAANEIRNGRMPPSDLKTYFPSGLTGSKARIASLQKASQLYTQDHPGEQLNESRLNRDYNNFKSPKTTTALQAVETFLPNLDKLQSAISQLPTNTPISALNSFLQKGEVQFGDKAATNVDMLKGVLAHELGASLGGGTALSDERIKMALKALNTNSTKETALTALNMLRSLEVNRHVNVALQGGVYGEQYLKEFYGDDTAHQLIEDERASRKKVGQSVSGGHTQNQSEPATNNDPLGIR